MAGCQPCRSPADDSNFQREAAPHTGRHSGPYTGSFKTVCQCFLPLKKWNQITYQNLAPQSIKRKRGVSKNSFFREERRKSSSTRETKLCWAVLNFRLTPAASASPTSSMFSILLVPMHRSAHV